MSPPLPAHTSVLACEYDLHWGRFEKRVNGREQRESCIAICKLFWYIWGFVNRQIWFSHSLVTIQRGRITYIKNNFYSRVTSTGMYTKHLPFKLKHWSSCNLLAFGRIARSTIGQHQSHSLAPKLMRSGAQYWPDGSLFFSTSTSVLLITSYSNWIRDWKSCSMYCEIKW